MRSFRWLFAFLLCVVATAPSNGTTILVNPDGNGDFPTIQDAVNAALDGDEIVLGDGTFTGSGNRDISYRGKAITIRSLSMNAEACIIDCQASDSDRHRGVSFGDSDDPDATFQEITITNGYVMTFGDWIGGAIALTGNAAPNIVGCIFTNCIAHVGGAICCSGTSAPVIRDCTFIGNSGDAGGGLYVHDGANPSIDDCRFSDNSAPFTGGGGAYCQGSAPTFTRCTFTNNSAAVGGGLLCSIVASPRIVDCSFIGNDAEYLGGGLGIEDRCGPTIEGCTFANNTSGTGGATYCWLSTAAFRRCTFYGNSARSGGGVGCWPGAVITMENTVLSFSSAGKSFVFSNDSAVTLTCTDIYGNANGDWFGVIGDQLGQNGNISEDPLFCDALEGDFRLQANSPCAPDHNPACGTIGAWPVGCGSGPAGVGADARGASNLSCAPNPFSQAIWIDYAAPAGGGDLRVDVFDTSGRFVRSLGDPQRIAGSHHVMWNGTNESGAKVPGGVYFVRARADGRDVTKRIVLVQ